MSDQEVRVAIGQSSVQRDVSFDLLAKEWLDAHDVTAEARLYLVDKLLPTLIIGVEKVLVESEKQFVSDPGAPVGTSSASAQLGAVTSLPFDPINWLAQYMMRNNPRFSNFSEASPYMKSLNELTQTLRTRVLKVQSSVEAKRMARRQEVESKKEEIITAKRDARHREEQRILTEIYRNDELASFFVEPDAATGEQGEATGVADNGMTEQTEEDEDGEGEGEGLLLNITNKEALTLLESFENYTQFIEPEEFRLSLNFAKQPTLSPHENLDRKTFPEYILGYIGDFLNRGFEEFMVETTRNIEMIKDMRNAVKTWRMRALHRLFEQWDFDGSGYIEFKELTDCLDNFMATHAPEVVGKSKDILKEADQDHDMKVGPEEFCFFVNKIGAMLNSSNYESLVVELTKSIGLTVHRRGVLSTLFDDIDWDVSGTIDQNEITHAIAHTPGHTQEDAEREVERMFHKYDTNNDGSLSREEFVIGMDHEYRDTPRHDFDELVKSFNTAVERGRKRRQMLNIIYHTWDPTGNSGISRHSYASVIEDIGNQCEGNSEHTLLQDICKKVYTKITHPINEHKNKYPAGSKGVSTSENVTNVKRHEFITVIESHFGGHDDDMFGELTKRLKDGVLRSRYRRRCLEKLFSLWDNDASGYVEILELQIVLQASLGINKEAASKEAAKFVNNADLNKDNRFDVGEFVAHMEAMLNTYDEERFEGVVERITKAVGRSFSQQRRGFMRKRILMMCQEEIEKMYLPTNDAIWAKIINVISNDWKLHWTTHETVQEIGITNSEAEAAHASLAPVIGIFVTKRTVDTDNKDGPASHKVIYSNETAATLVGQTVDIPSIEKAYTTRKIQFVPSMGEAGCQTLVQMLGVPTDMRIVSVPIKKPLRDTCISIFTPSRDSTIKDESLKPMLAFYDGLGGYSVNVLSTAEKEREEARRRVVTVEIFSHWDNDANGTIDVEELKTVLTHIEDLAGENVDQTVEHYLGLWDTNDDLKISLEEFLLLYKSLTANMDRDHFDHMSASMLEAVKVTFSEEKHGQVRREWLSNFMDIDVADKPGPHALCQEVFKIAEDDFDYVMNTMLGINVEMAPKISIWQAVKGKLTIESEVESMVLECVASNDEELDRQNLRCGFDTDSILVDTFNDQETKVLNFADTVKREENVAKCNYFIDKKRLANVMGGRVVTIPLSTVEKDTFGVLTFDLLEDVSMGISKERMEKIKDVVDHRIIPFVNGLADRLARRIEDKRLKTSTSVVAKNGFLWLRETNPEMESVTLYFVSHGSDPDSVKLQRGIDLDSMEKGASVLDLLETCGKENRIPTLDSPFGREEIENTGHLFRAFDLKAAVKGRNATHIALPVRDNYGIVVAIVEVKVGSESVLNPTTIEGVRKIVGMISMAYTDFQKESMGLKTRASELDAETQCTESQRVEMYFDKLMLLNLRRKVARLDASAFAELKSYNDPPNVIHKVIKGVLFIFGAQKRHVRRWMDCKIKITPSLIRRLVQYDPTTVQKKSRFTRARKVIEGIHTVDMKDKGSLPASFLMQWLRASLRLRKHTVTMRTKNNICTDEEHCDDEHDEREH